MIEPVRIDAHVCPRHAPDWHEHPASRAAAGHSSILGTGSLRVGLEQEAIGGVVLVAPSGSLATTRELLATVASDSRVVGIVGWVDLAAPDVADTIASLGDGPGGEHLVGLGHRVEREPDPDWLRRDEVRRGLAAVQASGLSFDLLVGPRELAAVIDTCRALEGLRFVLCHLGRPPIVEGDLSAWGGALLLLAELPNTHAKISGLVTEADCRTWSIDDLRHPIELAVDAFGPYRLMLGSDWPRCLAAGSYTDVIDAPRYLLAELPVHEQDEIRGLAAARFYRLEAGPT